MFVQELPERWGDSTWHSSEWVDCPKNYSLQEYPDWCN